MKCPSSTSTKPRVDALVSNGARAATSAAEAASNADFVFLSLNSPAIVRAAVFGDGGVADGARAGTIIIDMSSIDPPSTRALAEDAAERGIRWLDCPLSGGAPKALIGQLTVMAGGDAEDFEAAKEVMDDLCGNFTLMGPKRCRADNQADQPGALCFELRGGRRGDATRAGCRRRRRKNPRSNPRAVAPIAPFCRNIWPRWPPRTTRPPAASITW